MATHKITALFLGLVSLAATAQNPQPAQSEFKPSGKFDGKFFGDYYTSLNNDVNTSGFEMKRAYFGYTYSLSPEWSARVLLDIGDKDGQLNRYAFFKNAALFYTKNQWKIGFGMQDTYSMKTQEKIWGRRYVEKSFLDNYKFAHTADLGVTALYTVGDFAIDFGVFNGEGFKSTQQDNTYRGTAGVTANLFDNKLVLRISDEYERKYNVQNTVSAFVGYNGQKFACGAEYDQQTNFGHADGLDRGGFSVFGVFNASEKVSVFARYEELATDGSLVRSDDGDYLIAGVEYRVLKNLRGALNYQGKNYELTTKSSEAFLYASIEVNF